MTDLTHRNMQLVCDALEADELHYFSAPTYLFLYMPCRTDLKHREIRPTKLMVTITPDDTGVLFEARLPISLPSPDETTHFKILRVIAKENFGTLRGCLTYSSETARLQYHLYCAIGEDAAGFNGEEAAVCAKIAAGGLSEGYESIINALDSEDDDDGGNDSNESINAKLEALFDRLLSTRDDGDPRHTPGGESGSAEDSDPFDEDDEADDTADTVSDGTPYDDFD